MEATQKMECLPIWPTYIGEKGRTLGKTYRIKAIVNIIGGTHRKLREHIGNLMGTHWELEREHVRNKWKNGNNISLLGAKFDAFL